MAAAAAACISSGSVAAKAYQCKQQRGMAAWHHGERHRGRHAATSAWRGNGIGMAKACNISMANKRGVSAYQRRNHVAEPGYLKHCGFLLPATLRYALLRRMLHTTPSHRAALWLPGCAALPARRLCHSPPFA